MKVLSIIRCWKDGAIISVDNLEYLHGYLMRGIIYNVKKGECGKAISDFSKVIELAPRYAPAYNAKSWILATSPETKCRDGAKAVEIA